MMNVEKNIVWIEKNDRVLSELTRVGKSVKTLWPLKGPLCREMAEEAPLSEPAGGRRR
jgi:hypothetical protein